MPHNEFKSPYRTPKGYTAKRRCESSAQRLGGSTTTNAGASSTGGQFGGIGSQTQSVGGFGGFMSTGGY